MRTSSSTVTSGQDESFAHVGNHHSTAVTEAVLGAGAARGGTGIDFARRFPYSYAVVDVEATGLKARQDRVLSIGVVLVAPDGSVEDRWSTLLDPGCDPGPVHIHGLTREVLAGSPTFDQVLEKFRALLAGRVLVAHNARYDWEMLASEAMRANQTLTVDNRLCTWVLAQRLELPVRDLKLATLAAHWGVRQTRAHDAADDAAVLAALLPRLLEVAAHQDLELPLTPCDRELPAPYPGRAPRSVCPYRNPGRLGVVSDALVQGMAVAFTGASTTPRERLEAMAIEAGLKVAYAVSGTTSLLVTEDVNSGSRKAQGALARGIPVIDEDTFLRLLADVRSGTLRHVEQAGVPEARGTRASAEAARAMTGLPEPVGSAPDRQREDLAPAKPTADNAVPATVAGAAQVVVREVTAQPRATGARPLGIRRVLVLGGPHETAARLRERVVEAGGAAAVNVTLSVTDVVCLPGGDQDRRMPRIRRLGLPVHTIDDFLAHLEALGALLPGGAAQVTNAASRTADPAPARTSSDNAAGRSAEVAERILVRGAVVDLPEQRGRQDWRITATWDWGSGGEVDLVAFLLGADDRVESDEDMVFYNQPLAADGAVALHVDGPAEQAIALELDELPGSVQRIVIAAALDGQGVFGDVGPVAIAALSAGGQVELRATLDAATTERTLLLAEIYRRAGAWRFRAVGQGYDFDLARLAISYGLDVEA